VLTRAVPASRSITDPIGRVCDPVLGILGYRHDLEDPHFAILARKDMFESVGVHRDPRPHLVGVELVKKRIFHHFRWGTALIEAEMATSRVAWADIVEDRVSNTS